MNKYKELFKNTGIMAISQFSSKILVFLLVPLYTSVLSTAEYGVYDLVQSTIQLMVPLLTVNIVDAVMRFLMDEDVDQSAIITVGVRYLLLGSGLAIALMMFLKISGVFPSIEGMEFLVLAYFVVTMVQQFLVQTAKGLNNVKDMGIAGVLGTITTIFGCILCLLVLKMGLNGFFVANIFGQVIPSLYLSVRVKIWKYCKFTLQHKRINAIHREMLLYCVPLLANTLGWQLNSYFNKYTVAIILGEAATGLLGVAYKIPTVLTTMQTIFNQAWQISAIKEHERDNGGEFYCNIFTMMNVIMCLSCSGLILMIRILARILFAKDFFVAWEFVPLLLVSGVINAVAGVIGAILGATKDTRTMATAGISGIVVNIVLNLLLVGKMGIHGAVVATLISSFVIYVIRQISVRAYFDRKIILKTFFSWGLLIVQSIVAIRFRSIAGYLIQLLLIVGLVVCNWAYTRKLISKGLRMIFRKGKSK